MKLVLGTRTGVTPPLPRSPRMADSGRENKLSGSCHWCVRKGIPQVNLSIFSPSFPQVFEPGFQIRDTGCHWETWVIRNMRTCPCPHCSRAIAGKVDWAKPIPPWRRHSIIPEGEAEKNTPGERNSRHYLQSQLNPTYTFFP